MEPNQELKQKLQVLTTSIRELAEKSPDDLFNTLYILQELELLHRHIRIEMFEPSLPDTRHRLYLLMKHLEEEGGWPYIERMRLKNLCVNLKIDDSSETTISKNSSKDE